MQRGNGSLEEGQEGIKGRIGGAFFAGIRGHPRQKKVEKSREISCSLLVTHGKNRCGTGCYGDFFSYFMKYENFAKFHAFFSLKMLTLERCPKGLWGGACDAPEGLKIG